MTRRARIGGALLVLGLACSAKRGKIEVRATKAAFNECPAVLAFSVQPLEQAVGGEIAISVKASNPDGSAPTAHWGESARRGRFDDADADATTFTCDRPGATTILVLVSDEAGCSDTAHADVTCKPAQLCGNAQLDESEACDGKLSPGGVLGPRFGCAADCSAIIDRCEVCQDQYCATSRDAGPDEACVHEYCPLCSL